MIIQEKPSYKNYIKENGLKFYNLVINGKKYSFKVSKLFEILFLSDEDYISFLLKENTDEINKEYYLYAIKKLFIEYNLFDKYLFPCEIINRFFDIENSINNDLELGFNLNDIVIDKELKDNILKDISLFDTDLEKAIYIYIKMCKTLTYEEEYFAVGQSEEYEIVRKHHDISNIKDINLTNNKVVCHDFNAIYAKLLAELGIKFKINYTETKSYGKSHPSLTFLSSNYIVTADSVTSVLHGDLTNAKLNQKLKGLVCKNDDFNTKREFIKIFITVYEKIVDNEVKISKNKVMEYETLEDIKNEYCNNSNIELSLYEKLAILIKKVNSSSLDRIDSWSYLLQLRKILFTEEECDNNVKIVIIRNNEFTPIKATAIIIINEDNLANDFYDNEYFLYDIGSDPISLDVVTLQNKFTDGKYQYVIKSGSRIPNLILETNPFFSKTPIKKS